MGAPGPFQGPWCAVGSGLPGFPQRAASSPLLLCQLRPRAIASLTGGSGNRQQAASTSLPRRERRTSGRLLEPPFLSLERGLRPLPRPLSPIVGPVGPSSTGGSRGLHVRRHRHRQFQVLAPKGAGPGASSSSSSSLARSRSGRLSRPNRFAPLPGKFPGRQSFRRAEALLLSTGGASLPQTPSNRRRPPGGLLLHWGWSVPLRSERTLVVSSLGSPPLEAAERASSSVLASLGTSRLRGFRSSLRSLVSP